MKSITLLLALTVFSFQTIAQELLAQAKSGDNWGYINTKGEFVIDAQYKNCHAFSEGFAPIYDKKAKTFYFIRPDGSKLATDIEKFKLKNIFGFGTRGFTSGKAAVQVGKQWGYMKSDGTMLVDAKYEKANPFDGKTATAKLGSKWVIVDANGTETEIAAKGVEDVRKFTEELAPIKIAGKWGFVSQSGTMKIDAQYKSVGYFSDGLAWVKDESGLIGFIDKAGAIKIKMQFTGAKDFTEGMARVKQGESWTFVTTSGEVVNPEAADTYGKYSNGLAYAKKDGVVGFIDKSGKWVIKPQFEKVRAFKNGYSAVRSGEKWGFIDKKGNWVIEAKFDALKDFEKTN